MSDTRIEIAVSRIEDALARIADVADRPPAPPQSVSALAVKHQALRDAAAATLDELDALIGEIDR